jgi:predicted ATPase
MRTLQKTFAEEFERILVESDTSVGRLSRLSGISRRTLENWLYGNTLRPRYVDQILHVARALQLHAVDTDRLLLSAGHPTLTQLRQKKQLKADILLEWQLPPDTQKGQKKSALQHAQQLLRQMPWNEEVQREVMELLALNGRRSEALKQFEICKQALSNELGVEPSTETLALYERIRRTAHFSRDNIPAIVTPLIGREQELEVLSGLLADPGVRLVTITGLGGMGKTRLALDAAWQHTQGQFKDGVTFVELAAVNTADLLIPAIADALHLPLRAAGVEAARKELFDYLKAKQLLLVLDNCEHLLEGMTLAAEILEAAPQVNILATSREQLFLRGENVFSLQGLVYDVDQADHAAALLFSAAAKRVNPNFEINSGNAGYVNQLCHMVDGMPLALELAATWLNTIPVAALINEIEEHLDFLTVERHDMPPRHRSLRAVLESTWKRLQPETRRIFAALSVFQGSFSRGAAQEIAGASPALLRQLTAHSLLQYDHEGDRFQLHEMMRQFAAERLSENPEAAQEITRRYFAYFNDLARRGGEAMTGGDQQVWMARLELEYNNIRQAIDWAVNNDFEAAARLVVSQHIFWHTTGRYQEGAQQYERIMPRKDLLSADIHPWVLAGYAQMTNSLGSRLRAIALMAQAMPLFFDQEDEAGIAFVYLLWSYLARRMSEDINISIQIAEAGLRSMQDSGTDSFYASLLLDSLSDSLTRSGRFAEAGERVRQGYQSCVQRDDLMTTNYFLSQMTMLAGMQGKLLEARLSAEDHLSASRRLGMIQDELIALENLASITYSEGDYDQAETYAADGMALAREANYPYYLAALCLHMGNILMAKDDDLEALPFLSEALSLYQTLEDMVGIAYCISMLAELIGHFHLVDTAPVRWMASAITWLEAAGHVTDPDEAARQARVQAKIKARLGEQVFEQAWAVGAEMSFEEALEEILLALPQKTN